MDVRIARLADCLAGKLIQDDEGAVAIPGTISDSRRSFSDTLERSDCSVASVSCPIQRCVPGKSADRKTLGRYGSEQRSRRGRRRRAARWPTHRTKGYSGAIRARARGGSNTPRPGYASGFRWRTDAEAAGHRGGFHLLHHLSAVRLHGDLAMPSHRRPVCTTSRRGRRGCAQSHSRLLAAGPVLQIKGKDWNAYANAYVEMGALNRPEGKRFVMRYQKIFRDVYG